MARKLSQIFLKATRWLMKPVLQEFNFFLAVWLINCSVTLGYLAGCPFIDDNQVGHALRCLALGTAVSYLITTLLHISRPRWLRVSIKSLIYALLLTLQAVYVFIHLNFDMNLGPRVMVLLAETNGKEAEEFVTSYFLSSASWWTYAIMVLVIVAIAVAEWKRKWLTWLANRKLMRRLLTIVVLPLVLWGLALTPCYVTLARCQHSKQLNQWVQNFGVDALDHLSICYYSLCYLAVAEADVRQAVAVTQQVRHTPITITEPDSLNVVFVMGESYIKSHCALYGYSHNTTPHMLAERDKGNLIAFTNIISPYNATSQVQKNVFSLNDKSGGEMWYEKPMFPTVFRHAGYKVYFWDNQRNYAKTEMFTITVNSYIYNPLIANMSYNESTNGGMTFDAKLLENFRNKSRVEPGKYNLYIFHLMGQHVHPSGRFPRNKGFDRFNADSVKQNLPFLTREKRKYIAQYDNATLYNDHVMKTIFDMWRHKNTVVVYFSDHGDEAYDWRDHIGRGNVNSPDPRILHSDNDVPFMVWCSDTFIKLHPQLVNDLRKATTRPGMLHDVGNTLLRLAGINTPYYLPERDITSERYKPVPRIVYDKWDYDKAVKKN